MPWLSVDPAKPDLDAFPLYKHASPIVCSVMPGELLVRRLQLQCDQ